MRTNTPKPKSPSTIKASRTTIQARMCISNLPFVSAGNRAKTLFERMGTQQGRKSRWKMCETVRVATVRMRRNRLWEPNTAGRKTLSLGWEEGGKGGVGNSLPRVAHWRSPHLRPYQATKRGERFLLRFPCLYTRERSEASLTLRTAVRRGLQASLSSNSSAYCSGVRRMVHPSFPPSTAFGKYCAVAWEVLTSDVYITILGA